MENIAQHLSCLNLVGIIVPNYLYKIIIVFMIINFKNEFVNLMEGALKFCLTRATNLVLPPLIITGPVTML